jgi:trimethylamine--corrinoid protein Co-methyltransferase
VRRHLELPSFTGAAGYSNARSFDADAVAELTLSMMQTFYSRPATIDYLGSLDQGLTYSLHGLLLCDDLAGLLRTLWQGVRVDAEMLALDLAKEVGPRGNYLAHRHTVSHCREQLWPSRYFGPAMPLSSDVKPHRDLHARIDEDLRRIVANHRPPALDAALAGRLKDIREEFGRSHTA